MKNNFLKTRALWLWLGTAAFSPAVAQHVDNNTREKGRMVDSEILYPQEIDGRNVYLNGLVRFTIGLNLGNLVMFNQNEKDVLFVSDNGLVRFLGDAAIGVVIKDGLVSYFYSEDISNGKFYPTINPEQINQIKNLTMLHASQDSRLYKMVFPDNRGIGFKDLPDAKNAQYVLQNKSK